MKLPNILIHPGNGDASFLINGYKLPPGSQLERDFCIDPMDPDWPDGPIAVTVTFLADQVTVISNDPDIKPYNPHKEEQ